MATSIIHLSDIHFIPDNFEGLQAVLHPLFKDLERQVNKSPSTRFFVAFSGDIAKAGQDPDSYRNFFSYFDKNLSALGIQKENRICVPGNHDASRNEIEKTKIEHEGVVSLFLDERQFNDYMLKTPSVLTGKFSNYVNFEREFARYGVGESVFGAGWDIGDDIGVYCLNSALCASGGIVGADGKQISDKRRLGIVTRGLHQWVQSCSAKWRVLVMHHPLDWLIDWADNELKTLLKNDFSLSLSGHNHVHDMFHSISSENTLIECSSPPLFTKKSDQLGYAIITLDKDYGVDNISYRQWTKYQSFVSGVAFSNTDDGVVSIKTTSATHNRKTSDTDDFIERYLRQRLMTSLQAFSSQPNVWVEPTLSETPETNVDHERNNEFELSSILVNPKSLFIKAPPQYGLTCLGRFLCLEAWRQHNNFWFYIDAKIAKPTLAVINKLMTQELELFGLSENDINCIILDSWSTTDKDAERILQKICQRFPDLPVVCMQTVDSVAFNDLTDIQQIRKFDVLYLWSLERAKIRKIVSEYNDEKHIGDEDAIMSRVVSDLDVLNIHRTPLNCLTLLKVSELDFDESPVNRTEMIRRVLYLLFNVDDIPQYKTRPDLKDCEYVIGYFCEKLMRRGNYLFTREEFLRDVKLCCDERLIYLETHLLFDVLHANSILVKVGDSFAFKFSYWLFYFAAQRMHHSADFATYILSDMRYANYPEVIEFYAGIDRRRTDALDVLINDVGSLSNAMDKKLGFPDEFNPFRLGQWVIPPKSRGAQK
ncbi:MAG: metallophosphoesterase [Pseudomonadota bacterium]